MSFIASSINLPLAALVTVVSAFGATSSMAADDSISAYYGNTLLCQNQTSKAICHVWFNQDGTYFLMYDRGVQPDVPVTGNNANYRIEGRKGTYTVQGKSGAYEVCLKPDVVPGKKFAIEAASEIYAGKSCYVLPEHKVGESWMQTAGGNQQYKMWLVKGHG